MHKQRGKHMYDYLKFDDETLRVVRKSKEAEYMKELIRQFENYPVNITGMKPVRIYKQCKIVVTAYLIYITDGINAVDSVNIICDVLGYKSNKLPPLFKAFEKLGINPSIIRNYEYLDKLKSEHESMRKLPEMLRYIMSKTCKNK